MKRVIPFALLLLAGCAAPAKQAPKEHPKAAEEAEEAEEKGGDEVAVALEGVPANIRDAAMAACPGMKAERAAKETEDGVKYFEVSGKTADGAPVDVVLTEAGEVVAVETTVPVASAPENLKAAAVAKVPGLVLSRAERLLKKGVTTWEFKGKVDGKVYEIVVDEAGAVLEVED
jgi:uncharacterized membrane protein YkoI